MVVNLKTCAVCLPTILKTCLVRLPMILKTFCYEGGIK
jgi:hypothetical protein